MQSAEYLDVVKPGPFAGPLPCNSLSEHVLGLDVMNLSCTYPPRVVLFAEGQSAVGVYVLRAGRAKVSIASSEGKTLIMRIARAGDLLGVNSVLKGLPHEATVETLERCCLSFVSSADFMSLLDNSKAARVGVSQYLCNELSELVDRTRLILLSQSAREKLVRLLLKWYDEVGEPTPKGTRLNHGLTHEEIGQMICASRETVSRLFTELKRKQVVRLNGTGIFVSDRAALEMIAE